jgi:hypothetical protein
MNELAIERRIAFSTTHYLNYRTLMFETEPTIGLKESIDRMMDVSQNFLGIYFSTVGTRHSYLYNLTPIEYEICQFIRKFCRLPNSEEKCLICIRNILTQHYPENINNVKHLHQKCKDGVTGDKKYDGHPGRHFCSQVRNQENSNTESKTDLNVFKEKITHCRDIIGQAAQNIFLFCKYNSDEHAMSPQLLVLLRGLSDAGIVHIDFKDEWDLANLIANTLEHKNKHTAQSTKKIIDPLGRYLIDFKHKNKPSKLKAFLDAVFIHNLNIDQLFCYPISKDDNKFIATVSDYSVSERDQSQILSQLRHKLFVEGYKKDKIGAASELIFTDDNEKNFILKGYSKQIEKLEKNDLTNVYFKFNELYENLKDVKELLLIRIYHLDVPGIICNITKALTDEGLLKLPFQFNIEWCLTTSRSDYEYHVMDYSPITEKCKSVAYTCGLNDKNQTTELLLSIIEKNPDNPDIDNYRKFRRINENPDNSNIDTVKLEISLNSIIGVQRAIISK